MSMHRQAPPGRRHRSGCGSETLNQQHCPGKPAWFRDC